MLRKAQAAMEFLMTYGWAILVVLICIGALAYFGVLSPRNLLPQKCIASTNFNCNDALVSNSGLLVKISSDTQIGDGNSMPSGHSNFKGKIDEVYIFSRALTDEEVRNLANI